MKGAMTSTPSQSRHRQRASTTQADQIPSYASPTASSKAKSHAAEWSKPPSTPSKSQRRQPPHRDFKTCYLSTEASRKRSLWTGPFRFLDLPGDVRNIIYDYIAEDCIGNSSRSRPIRYAPHKAGVTSSVDPAPYWPYPRPYTRKLPALFCVKSKQIREEFGGYVFTQCHIAFVSWTRQGLQDLLRFIGIINFKRLLANKHAYLQVWYSSPIWLDHREALKVEHPWSWKNPSEFIDENTLWKCGPREEA